MDNSVCPPSVFIFEMRFFRLILLFISLSVLTSSAQEKEWGSNIGVDIQKKFGKKFALSLSEEVRLDNDFMHFDRFASTLSGSFQLVKKHLKGGVSYGALVYNKDSYCLLNHRLSAGLTGEAEAGKFSFALRGKYQTTIKDDSYGKQYKLNPEQYLRMKLSVEYTWKKPHLYPFVSAEVYYGFFEKDITMLRYSAGIDHKFDKRNSLGLAFEMKDSYKRDKYFINLGYKFRF